MSAPRKSLHNARWRRIRRQVLDAEPLCRHCLSMGIGTEATEVDHIDETRPDCHDIEGLQPLCKSCHSSKTRAAQLGKVKAPVGLDGVPQGWGGSD